MLSRECFAHALALWFCCSSLLIVYVTSLSTTSTLDSMSSTVQACSWKLQTWKSQALTQASNLASLQAFSGAQRQLALKSLVHQPSSPSMLYDIRLTPSRHASIPIHSSTALQSLSLGGIQVQQKPCCKLKAQLKSYKDMVSGTVQQQKHHGIGAMELKSAKKNSNTIILVCLLAVPVRLGEQRFTWPYPLLVYVEEEYSVGLFSS